MYLSELTLPEYTFLRYEPALVAAGCVYMALFASRMLTDAESSTDTTVAYQVGQEVWTPELQFYARLERENLKSCVVDIQRLWEKKSAPNGQLKAIQDKFARSEGRVSKLRVPSLEQVTASFQGAE